MTDNKANPGDHNTGNRNTGNWNTGNRNTGYCNTGDHNTGSRNTGNRNTGDWNTGNRNTGYWNTGNWNTGYWNTGNRNTGYWNTGNRNTGYCNTVDPQDCLVFNKPCTFDAWVSADKPIWMHVGITQWISESDMSDKEKEAFPTYVTTGGYLKIFTTLHHAYIEAWGKADEKDKAKTFKLPNFDASVFEEIFGFNPCKKKHIIIIDGETIEVSEDSFAALKKSLTK